MGAAASIRAVYSEALKWFVMYIDKETYIADFHALDKDDDGGVDFNEFIKWIQKNAEKYPGTCWSTFLTSGAVLKMSHKFAASSIDDSSSVTAKSIVDVGEFRSLLIHLFATSIMWRHFISVNNWKDCEEDVPRMIAQKIDVDEFSVAVRSLCAAHEKEELTDEQLREDFNALDTNFSGKIGFIQLCVHACKYIDQLVNNTADDHDQFAAKASKFLGIDDKTSKNFVDMKDLADGPKKIFEGITVEERNERAMKQIATKLDREDEKVKEFHQRKHKMMNNSGNTEETMKFDVPTETTPSADVSANAAPVPTEAVTTADKSVSAETAPVPTEAVTTADKSVGAEPAPEDGGAV